MSKNNQQTTSTQTTTTSNFEQKADKWWESRWAFVMAIAVPLISIMLVYSALQLADLKQSDQIKNVAAQVTAMQAQQTLFQQGDFKDSQQRVTDLEVAVNQLTVQIAQLQTIINERIPKK